jgi:hypothetical protein
MKGTEPIVIQKERTGNRAILERPPVLDYLGDAIPYELLCEIARLLKRLCAGRSFLESGPEPREDPEGVTGRASKLAEALKD